MPKKTKTKPSFNQKIHYYIDNYLAKGSSALFLSLLFTFLSALAFFSVVRILLSICCSETPNWLENLWMAFLQLTAPGSMGRDTESPAVMKLAAVFSGFTGVVIFSTLIATLTTALNSAIANLKQGHSRVLESEHTLIVGWNKRVTEILKELVEANESEDDPVVVIMSEKDKPWMDEYLRSNFKDRGNTRIVTRSGNPASPENLAHVNAEAAKSVIVLANCDDNASEAQQVASDARGIKVVLALETAAPDAEFPIVTELFLERNRQVVLGMLPGRVKVIDSEEILAKVMVQTSRTSGLSTVYSELLSFDGCEMYITHAKWNGITFGKSQFHFPDGVPIGIRRPTGEVELRPSVNTVLEEDFELLIVAEDDSTIDFKEKPVAVPKELTIPDRRSQQKKEKMLMLGWSTKAPTIISEHAEYVLEGSEVIIALYKPTEANRIEIAHLNDQIDELDIRLTEINPFDGEQLKQLKPFEFDDIIILPQSLGTDGNAERIDSETIVVLLLLRSMRKEILAEGGEITTKIVTEVLDSSNQSLIHHAGVNDFIISNRIVSMLFAQISEEPEIQKVYDDLFQEDGSEIYVKPVELYFDSFPQQVTFADIMALVQQRDEEVCIGVKIGAKVGNADENFGIKLIPFKDVQYELDAGDALVVVAEDEQ